MKIKTQYIPYLNLSLRLVCALCFIFVFSSLSYAQTLEITGPTTLTGTNPITGETESHLITGGCPDFMTGGGWFIDPRRGSEKISFGFVLGFKDKQTSPSGSLNLTDHNTKMHVKSVTVDRYFCGMPAEGSAPGICRRVEGTVKVTYPDGVTGPIPAGTYSFFLYVCDKGEPGNETKGNDVFEIYLTNGTNSWDATSRADAAEGIDGGNIQHHAKKDCQPCAAFFGAPPRGEKTIAPEGKLSTSWAKIKSRYSKK